MQLAAIRRKLLACCRALPHVTEDIKWTRNLVFSIGGKMFAVLDPTEGAWVAMKAAPADFAQLVTLPGVVPAPYAARYHWVLVTDASTMPAEVRAELIEASYQLVLEGLPKRKREALLQTPPPAKPKRARSATKASASRAMKPRA